MVAGNPHIGAGHSRLTTSSLGKVPLARVLGFLGGEETYRELEDKGLVSTSSLRRMIAIIPPHILNPTSASALKSREKWNKAGEEARLVCRPYRDPAAGTLMERVFMAADKAGVFAVTPQQSKWEEAYEAASELFGTILPIGDRGVSKREREASEDLSVSKRPKVSCLTDSDRPKFVLETILKLYITRTKNLLRELKYPDEALETTPEARIHADITGNLTSDVPEEVELGRRQIITLVKQKRFSILADVFFGLEGRDAMKTFDHVRLFEVAVEYMSLGCLKVLYENATIRTSITASLLESGLRSAVSYYDFKNRVADGCEQTILEKEHFLYSPRSVDDLVRTKEQAERSVAKAMEGIEFLFKWRKSFGGKIGEEFRSAVIESVVLTSDDTRCLSFLTDPTRLTLGDPVLNEAFQRAALHLRVPAMKYFLEHPSISPRISERNLNIAIEHVLSRGNRKDLEAVLGNPKIVERIPKHYFSGVIRRFYKREEIELIKLFVEHPGIAPFLSADAIEHVFYQMKLMPELESFVRVVLNNPDVYSRISNRCLETTLILAVGAGFNEVAKLIINNPAIRSRIPNESIGKALIHAASRDNTTAMQLLIDDHFAFKSISQEDYAEAMAVASSTSTTDLLKMNESDV